MSDKPEGSPDKEKPKDADNMQTRLPPNTPSISGSEASPETSRNVDELRNREDLIGWFDDADEEKISEVKPVQKQRRTVKPNVYKRRITRPGTDIKKELEELAKENPGRWREEPSPLQIAAENKQEQNRVMKRIAPFEQERSISPTRSLDFSTSLSPSPSPTFTPRYGLLFDSSDLLPEISIRMNGGSPVTIRNALIVSIVLFCLSLIILAVSIYKLKFS